ncbi:MAG TPA: AMP-binding protein [Thermoanaerobaculia bacterium]
MTKPHFPLEPSTLSELLTSRAQSEGDRLAFAEGDARLTYRELYDEASAIASGFVANGIRPGDRVALSLHAGLAFIRVFWALQLVGAVTCALNPYTPPASVLRRAMRVRPRLLVTHDEALANEARAANLETTLLADLPRSADPLPPNGVTPEDVAVLQTTSGTSGEPRAAMIRQRNIMVCVDGAITALGFSKHDVLVSWVPPWHDLGLIRFVIGTVYFGAACHIIQPAIQTIPEWMQTIGRVGGTITGAPDFAYRLAARLVDPKTVDLSSLRDATNGGEPVRLSTIESFERAFNAPGVMKPGYGLAEATLGVTCRRPDQPTRTDARGNVSNGIALPTIELRIDAEPGEPGEIVVGGPLVFAGYFEAEEATNAVLRDGELYTGDIGQLDADGHLYVLGRKRAMLKRGGAVLAPRELEEAAQRVDGVKIAMAVGVTSEFATEEIVVAVEIDEKEDVQRIAREVAESVRATLGFAPERVLAMKRNSLPRTYNGKLRHDALRTALLNGTLASAILH